jgi:hypothetical protein
MGHPPCRKGHERNPKGRTRQMPAQRFCDLDLSFRKLWVPDPLRHESVPRTRLTAALCGPRICPAHLIDCRRKGWVDRTSTLTFIPEHKMWVPHPLRPTNLSYAPRMTAAQSVGLQNLHSHIHPRQKCGCPILCGHYLFSLFD